MTFVVGASQVQPLETDGFSERSPKIQLNASRRPLLEELVMVLHCAARKLSAQLWLQPKPQTHHVKELQVTSFIQLALLLAGGGLVIVLGPALIETVTSNMD